MKRSMMQPVFHAVSMPWPAVSCCLVLSDPHWVSGEVSGGKGNGVQGGQGADAAEAEEDEVRGACHLGACLVRLFLGIIALPSCACRGVAVLWLSREMRWTRCCNQTFSMRNPSHLGGEGLASSIETRCLVCPALEWHRG